MYKNTLKYKVLFILAITGFFLWFGFPLKRRINLGLDLRGGMHLVLRVDTSAIAESHKNDAVEMNMEKIRYRIDRLGVAEPFIQRQGFDQIVVELPGVTDRARAKELIGTTGLLEFRLVNDDPQALAQASSGTIPDGYEYKKDEDGRPILLSKTAALTGDAIKDASVGMDQYGLPSVKIEFNDKGIKAFGDLTGENINKRLAIVLDGAVRSAPAIRSKIDSGQAEITSAGGFEPTEANKLKIVLESGALPAPMVLEEERTIGPLLGADSIQSGIKASIIGTLLVFGFMAVYYFTSGLIACVALFLNFLLVIGSLGFLGTLGFPATLTLPGIAGIVLTLGMAVDANVLINERVREELKLGKNLWSAVGSGYEKAFSAIFDSNLTTLIAAVFLFWFGTGPIRGFAITLTIGLVASMFTAIFVTRTIFELLLLNKKFTSLKMLQLLGPTKLDFIGKRRIFFVISLIVIITGMFVFFKKGKNAYGIDFSGGQIQEYQFERPITADTMRGILHQAGVTDAAINQYKEDARIISIRTAEDTAEAVGEKLKASLPDNKFSVLRVEKVGPIAGKQLQQKAIFALCLSLLGILVYVAFRFKHIEFGIAGIIAIFHDILVALGFLALTGRQVDLLVVTALLTIAGYSINDTIVIYDRVRENMRLNHRMTLKDVINLSVNQCLSRTILTTGVTLFVVIALFFWGGEVLNNFAFTLLVGFISGVYSTVYIASPLVLAFAKKRR